MAKGSQFERDVCRQISLWWTYGKNDDVFWRTSGSGARAKTRSKKNLRTFGQYGDIQATDPIGQKLIDLFSIELKRGYNKDVCSAILDKPIRASQQGIEKFIEQATTDSKNAGAISWWLIHRRDRKIPVIYMPYNIAKKINKIISGIRPIIIFSYNDGSSHQMIFGTPLEKFLKFTRPSAVKKLWDATIQNPIHPKTQKEVEMEDQIHKCLNCEETKVQWTGGNWTCGYCQSVFNKDEYGN